MKQEFIDLQIDGVSVRVAAMVRPGPDTPVLFLHGFGSTKEDYADVVHYPPFEGRTILAYDAPGCGATECADLSALSIPFLCKTAIAMLDHYGIDRFHLAGHSMGGLTALMLAHDLGDRVVSFTDIEGNVAPEDCFLSRQILTHPAATPDAFLEAFAARAWAMPYYAHPLYASTVRHKVRAGAVAPIFTSMVDLSDNRPLLSMFADLPAPKMFVYGEQNRTLSYLRELMRCGVQLAEIPHSGHFPMYANPVALWTRMGDFIRQAEVTPMAATPDWA